MAAALSVAALAHAEDAIVTYKSLAPDTALDLARAALQQCRKDGFQIAVVVILKIASRGLRILGSGTLSTWTRPFPCQHKAFIVGPPELDLCQS